MATLKQDVGTRRVLGVKPAARGSAPASPEAAWHCLGLIGAAFLVVGGVDMALTWVPLGFGSMEWEFGTVTATFDGLPVPALGLVLLLSSGLGTGRRWLVRSAALAMALVGVVVIAAAVIYATTVPLALSSVPEGAVRVGVQKAVAKTSIQAAVYPVILLWIAISAWRRTAVQRVD